MATLFGLKPEDSIPPPATEAEKKSWGDPSPEASAMDLDDESTVESDRDIDPHFPYYPNGPGHLNATPQTLKIIRREMDRCRVSAFRPDLGRPWASPDNTFLWTLAMDTFIKLVECGEYTGISLRQYDRRTIERVMKRNVVNTWQRRSVPQCS